MKTRYLRYSISPRYGQFMIRAFGRFVALKAPWCKPLFSERERVFPVFALGFGWRITLRPVPTEDAGL